MTTWTDVQLMAVKELGPALIGPEMFAAKEDLLKRTVSGGGSVLGPLILGTEPITTIPPAITAKLQAALDEPRPLPRVSTAGETELATRDELEALNYAELRGLAAEANLQLDGNPKKVALIEALLQAGIKIALDEA